MQDRIKILLEFLKVSHSDFAQKLGVQRSSVSHVLSGRNNPSLDFLQKIILAYPEISADWLLLGKGEIKRNEGEILKNTEHLPSSDKINKEHEEFLADQIIVLNNNGTFRIYYRKQ